MDFACDFSDVFGLKLTLACDEISPNVLKFQNPFEKNEFPGNKQVSIAFRDRILPGSNLMIKGILIQTYMTLADGEDYLIDTFDDDEYPFFAPASQLFLQSSVFVDKEETYEETPFYISNKLANNVKKGAIIHVTIPKQVEVIDPTVVVKSCQAQKNLQPTLYCELSQNEDLSHQLTVRDAFGKNGLSKEFSFSLKIGAGLLTPISKKTSETFVVVITDEFGYEINYIRNSLSLTMAVGKDIEPIELSVGSDRVGDRTSHMVSFSTPTPLYDDFLIIVNIPEECRPPMNN